MENVQEEIKNWLKEGNYSSIVEKTEKNKEKRKSKKEREYGLIFLKKSLIVLISIKDCSDC